jgi:hypothetical protein
MTHKRFCGAERGNLFSCAVLKRRKLYLAGFRKFRATGRELLDVSAEALEERLGPEVSDVDAVKLARIWQTAEGGEDPGPTPTVESVKQRLAEWVRDSRERRDPQ